MEPIFATRGHSQHPSKICFLFSAEQANLWCPVLPSPFVVSSESAPVTSKTNHSRASGAHYSALALCNNLMEFSSHLLIFHSTK